MAESDSINEPFMSSGTANYWLYLTWCSVKLSLAAREVQVARSNRAAADHSAFIDYGIVFTSVQHGEDNVVVKALREFVEVGFVEELRDQPCDKEKRSIVFVGQTNGGKSFIINTFLRATMADAIEEEENENEKSDAEVRCLAWYRRKLMGSKDPARTNWARASGRTNHDGRQCCWSVVR